MMNYLLIAMAAMVGATLAQHLGLTEAIEGVVRKISRCNMCCTFWIGIATLIANGCDPVLAALLSIISAYASNWFVVLLIRMQGIYDRLWRKINK